MFLRTTVISLSLFALFSLIWAYQTFGVRASDIELYAKIKEAQESAPSARAFSTASHQTRRGICKEIWAAQEDGTRTQTRIESDSSVLTLHPKGNRLEIVEDLYKIRFWMQDRLYLSSDGKKPLQQMRYLEADTGTYLYNTQQFLAQTVALSLFRLPGHTLTLQHQTSPFVKGIAQDVSFSVSGKESQFQAKNFKANFSGGPL